MNRICVVLFTLSANTSFAQEKELASINYSVLKLMHKDTSANARQIDAKIKLPVYRKKSDAIITTISYKNLSLHNFPQSFEGNLYGIAIQLVWFKKLSDKRNLAFFSLGGLFSDMNDISGKDFRYSIGFRYRIKHSERLSTGWGLAYSRQFFGSQVIPFIDIDYKLNDKWSITGQFPIKPKILYHFNKKVSAGFELAGDASSYRLSARQKQNKYIQQNQWTGLAKLEYQFARSWQLNIGLGSNLKQTYKLYTDASSAPWTIITIPLGKRDEPVEQIESWGLNMQVGISFKPF